MLNQRGIKGLAGKPSNGKKKDYLKNKTSYSDKYSPGINRKKGY